MRLCKFEEGAPGYRIALTTEEDGSNLPTEDDVVWRRYGTLDVVEDDIIADVKERGYFILPPEADGDQLPRYPKFAP